MWLVHKLEKNTQVQQVQEYETYHLENHLQYKQNTNVFPWRYARDWRQEGEKWTSRHHCAATYSIMRNNQLL
jgi:starvation-inducible outer membrane lipoprotein